MPAYPNRKVSKRPPGKKPSNDDVEVLEDAGEEAPPAEGEEEEAPADEGAEWEGEEEANSERLKMPRKSAINGSEDRISFVPLRTTKARKLDDAGRAAGVSGKIQLPGSVASGVPKWSFEFGWQEFKFNCRDIEILKTALTICIQNTLYFNNY